MFRFGLLELNFINYYVKLQPHAHCVIFQICYQVPQTIIWKHIYLPKFYKCWTISVHTYICINNWEDCICFSMAYSLSQSPTGLGFFLSFVTICGIVECLWPMYTMLDKHSSLPSVCNELICSDFSLAPFG